MGANDFRSFVVGYFVELSIAILQRLYLDPAREELSKLWPRWRMLLRRRLSRRRRMTREEKAKVKFLEEISRLKRKIHFNLLCAVADLHYWCTTDDV
jgi:hypothetical protein